MDRAVNGVAPGKVLNVSKIAVLRANAIGDFFFALPALEALRAAYPAAEIVLLGQEWHAGFLHDRPGPVDRVVVVPPQWREHEAAADADAGAALASFFTAMAAERFDLALQIYGGGHQSNPFMQRLGARVTAGLKAPDAPPLQRWVPYIYYQPEIMRYLEVVALVGAPPVRLEPRLVVTSHDRAEAARHVPESVAPLVVLHPGAGDTRRRWPPEKFAALGDALAAAGAHVIITGIAAERPVADAVAAAMEAEACNLCGRLSLEGLAGLLSRARVVVSNDSGPLHMARAVGTPTVGIYWCGNVITAGGMTRTNHRVCMSWQLRCPTCGRHCVHDPCDHRPSFVAEVATDDVIAAARELFAAERTPAAV